jgi:glutamyl-tRNA synthetase
MTPSRKIRVRFAPSPTGPVNFGTSRTALFNWLYAKSVGGEFILRIEDTDKERSKKEYEENILRTLAWLGFDFSEMHRQSDRTDVYADHLRRLIDQGNAYYCFCSEEELEAERESQLAGGLPPRYGGKCRTIPREEAEERRKSHRSVIRFKMPEKKISFSDLVRGSVAFDTALIGDIVIAKSVTEPLYNFAVVVDDHDMEISHVIRGEDHISNTPKQIAIAEALGFEEKIHFAHLPLILGPDKKKLSKRDMAKSVEDYAREGYLPSAVFNFLVLLGWHPEKDREIISRAEAVAEFTLERVQKAGAVMNAEKLDWLNAHYIRALSDEAFLEAVSPFVSSAWKEDAEKFARVMQLQKERIKKLDEASGGVDFFFTEPRYTGDILPWKGTSPQSAKTFLKAVSALIDEIPEGEFTLDAVSGKILPYANEAGRGEVLWPMRVALTGLPTSPGPFECAAALGKRETLNRLQTAIEKLS